MTTAKTKRQMTVRMMKRHWQMYLLLLLPLLYLLIFKYYPMLGTQIAFKKFRASQGIWGSEWIGFANFAKFFKSYQFSRVMVNTIAVSFYQLIAGFPFPIIFALLLNTLSGKWFKKTVQTVTYLPYFISVVVLVGMMFQIFNPTRGIYGTLYTMATGTTAPDLFGKSEMFRHMYVWSGVWQNMGFNSVIYIAALSSVSNDLHEAAMIDGIGRFKRMLYIDLPAIIPTMTVLLILNAGRIMSIGFEKVYLMQNDLNLRTSEIISTYVYKVGLAAGGGDFAYATAIGLFNSAVNLILIVTVNKICNRLGETSLW
ncbi:ABC transporter permease subunit [Ruminococcaceae bacterium OttesenSCG-928-L11]|nr:ABC transporter permease subunit [Ruminococcaceae bacterium OttesenSCG-928-L11]